MGAGAGAFSRATAPLFDRKGRQNSPGQGALAHRRTLRGIRPRTATADGNRSCKIMSLRGRALATARLQETEETLLPLLERNPDFFKPKNHAFNNHTHGLGAAAHNPFFVHGKHGKLENFIVLLLCRMEWHADLQSSWLFCLTDRRIS